MLIRSQKGNLVEITGMTLRIEDAGFVNSFKNE